MRIAIILAAATWASPSLAATEAAALPGWIAGAWTQADGETWAEEYWTSPRGGIMLGAGKSGRGEKLTAWEAMRIERDITGTIAFFGSPKGTPPVRFPLVSATATEAVFLNPSHDYPQRIRYWRDGKLLHAEVSLADGGKPMRWTYRPMGE